MANGYFKLPRSRASQTYGFNLHAANHQVILRSGTCAGRSGTGSRIQSERENGTDAVKQYVPADDLKGERGRPQAQGGLIVRQCFVALATVAMAAATGCTLIPAPVAVDPFPMEWVAMNQGLEFCERVRTRPWHLRGRTSPARCIDTGSITTIQERNDLQHRLMGMATQLCLEFRTKLYGETKRPIYLRAAGSLTGVASASLIPHDMTAEAVESAADVVGSVAGDLDGYFRETKMNIALSGVELARTRMFKQIVRSRQEDLATYPVGRAINDAMRYHGVCTLADGLSESAGAVEAATATASS